MKTFRDRQMMIVRTTFVPAQTRIPVLLVSDF